MKFVDVLRRKSSFSVWTDIIDGKINLDNCEVEFSKRPRFQQPTAPHTPQTMYSQKLAFIPVFVVIAEIISVVKTLQLHRLAEARRRDRLATGSITLQRTKLSFILDEAGLPLSHLSELIRESNQLIEEFMYTLMTTGNWSCLPLIVCCLCVL